MPDLRIQNTKIVETPKGFVIEMTLSDSPDLESAPNVVQVRTTLDTDEKGPRLVALQRVALDHVQTAINAEIQRLLRLAESTR
jgi:hypothetical protein